MRKEGRRLIIEASEPKSLVAWLDQLEPLAEDLPPIRRLPARGVKI
jgi:hypothetical protein